MHSALECRGRDLCAAKAEHFESATFAVTWGAGIAGQQEETT
ncbi:MAG: hypothetical protein ACLR7M_04620 [Varibaculum timonense]|nr:hypothetical protein [Varibaculum timonense]